MTLEHSLTHLISTLHGLKIRRHNNSHYDAQVMVSGEMVRELEKVLNEYRDVQRLDVIKPFASLFDPSTPHADKLKAPSHRGLYWYVTLTPFDSLCIVFSSMSLTNLTDTSIRRAFSYQNALMGFSETLLDLLRETVQVEKKRKTARFMFPEWSKMKWAKETSATSIDEVSQGPCETTRHAQCLILTARER